MKMLITGMSGTGKSSVIQEFGHRGHTAIDTDSEVWSHWAGEDWVWREDRMEELLQSHTDGKLFVCGCKSNQGKFYPHFDHVVLLHAPLEVMHSRIMGRPGNPYGQRPEEWQEICSYVETVLPLLKSTSTLEIDTSQFTVSQVVEQLLHL